MNTREPQYQRDLIAALDRLGGPESEHSCFRLSSDAQTVYIHGPDGMETCINVDQSVMHEDEMSEAIEKKLRAAGLRPRMARSHSN